MYQGMINAGVSKKDPEVPNVCRAKQSSAEGKSKRAWGPKLEVSCLDSAWRNPSLTLLMQ